ncbi:c-type cytochrome biogenesis protein CcmI [Yersinia pseudotuberculosis]|uniref:Cytochrome c-type biogenesis protein CcmI n=3 Tax=Yersinia pseudotuberculosis complex TaxID=1649845 RepID=A0A0H3B1N0_YERPY|nr:c-type cytochrome biogenesis protein CcmI [Yersinia pseudotuberculosis]AJJ59398.1 cytochrome c-type biogenesis protein CcmI [Yersinia pseudotuberculosis YPIII]AYW87517.1 c-type cytochrome biogenesis protein CcmI [Yersinia pseudotuberculosis]AYX02069.1 c-type cytochrome biogenesis protein CcmI [Yersinia pseudotuberculosis]AZA29826.1 c-type cytochrome biogenesis protein CcmI [Yersinia pseudotuberculosis]MBK1425408.1 c-type cytochrome biogenesis protein CcmI [Yersinia pseudotuberculosis]
MAFWLIVIISLAVAGALLVIPVIRKNENKRVTTRDELNKAIYRDRLSELAEDEAQGVIAERPELVKELQQNLLTDIPQQLGEVKNPINRWVLLPGVVVLVAVAVGLYLKTGGLEQVAAWHQVAAQMPELRARVANEHADPLSMEDVARLGLGLRTSLQQDAGNVNDWMMLGRVGMTLNNATTATQAFAHAYQLAPDNNEVKLGYVEVLTRSNDPEDNQLATQMLRAMVGQDHTNLRAMSLLAFNAFEQGDFKQAIAAWEVMLKLLPASDSRVDVVKRSIQQAKSQIEQETATLGIEVSLSSDAAQALPQQGALIISVTNGINPVPVAVKQLPLSRFPLAVTLDDSNAMMPERLLSSLQQVKVRVRLSLDGAANAQSGDWYGESAVQDFKGNGPSSEQKIGVQINKQIP